MSAKRGRNLKAAPLSAEEIQTRLDLLRHSLVLGGVDAAVLTKLATGMVAVNLKANECIFRKGDRSDSMYVIARGCVRIHDGDYVFTHLEPPESFGEYALVHDSIRTASATASATTCGETTVLRLDRTLFESQLHDDSGFLQGLLHAMLKRMIEKDCTEKEIAWNREQIRKQCDQIAGQRDEMDQQRRQLAQMNAAKDKFFSIVAHDLKNPLMALSLISRSLTERPAYLTPAKAQEYAQLVCETATVACRLMENLLDWSRSQTNTMRFVMEPILLHEAVRDSLGLLEVCAQQKQIDLRNEVPSGIKVFADAQSLSAIIRNLVSNAVKYTATGGHVTVAATPAETHVECMVTDSGVGIEPLRLGDIFRTEVGASTRGTANEAGTGLGLRLCKEFAEKNNGAIRVTSEVGKGTTFYVTLPKA